MGAFLSPARKAFRLLPGLTLFNRGKVRDTYLLPDGIHLLIVTSDGISIFDYVLNASVPMKGYVLNMMSVFWLQMMEQRGFPTHFVAAGCDIDAYLPDGLKNDADLQARAMVVKKTTVDSGEFVYRNVLTGSSVDPYNETGAVCGIRLPKGLQDSDKIDRPLFTPTTKAEVGHDEHVDAQKFFAQYPTESFMGYQIFLMATRYAESCGILIADTKFEFGTGEDGTVMLIDEVLSPDSSRFWSMADWLAVQGQSKRKAPPSFDKQPVRDYGAQLGINDKKRSPKNAVDREWIWSLTLPEEILAATSKRYRYIFWRLTGFTVEAYAKKLGVILPHRRKNVAVIMGSANDLTDDVRAAIKTACIRYSMNGELGHVGVHVLSCHRNTPELVRLATNDLAGIKLDEIDYVIAGAGWAAQLPGMLDALLFHNGYKIPVIGLALGEPGTKELQAAQLSIECLPSYPVITDEIHGRQAYTNTEGLSAIFDRLATGELPPPQSRKTAEVQLNVVL